MPEPLETVNCPTCGQPFEDIAVAVAQHGGWCPRCDRPINQMKPIDPAEAIEASRQADLI